MYLTYQSQLPPDFFRSCHKNAGASGLTLLNYPVPPAGTPLTEVDIRAGAHKDWGSITLLFQQAGGQPGLEIFVPAHKDETSAGVKLISQVDLSNGTPFQLSSIQYIRLSS